MTRWQEQPLRPQGQSWPGLNTRGGRLDDGRGWLEDGSINVQINSSDTLEKRKGMVRGIEEYFGGVVCGLFKYTDYCGQEWLLVANEDGIDIRQPFLLPQFTASDAYPNDAFDGDGDVNISNWRNFDRYVRFSDRMAQVLTSAPFTGPRIAPGLFMRWFKAAGALAYEVTVTYKFDPVLQAEQRISAIIRGNGDLSTGAFLQADVVFHPAGTYQLQVFHREADLNVRELLTQNLVGVTTDPRGTMSLRYERDLGTNALEPVATVLPNQGTFTTARAPSLSALQDADLGLVSALAVGQADAVISQNLGVEVVTGGPA